MVTSADRSDDQKAPSRGLTRREFLPLLSAAPLATVATRSRAAAAARASGAEARFVYVGTYTAPGVPPGGTHPSTAVGIYVFSSSLRWTQWIGVAVTVGVVSLLPARRRDIVRAPDFVAAPAAS